ncbi:hypothetical protein NS258_02375 [Sphingomonas sanguinis]|uniref:Uncharacterized protein n=1 Tax=Sphingomonas sanguinis TaxID=33051 RepID=A0A147JCB9_9SPHN|nr:hypothetical protein NS258_02375 [Sphingomonas sanguinis]
MSTQQCRWAARRCGPASWGSRGPAGGAATGSLRPADWFQSSIARRSPRRPNWPRWCAACAPVPHKDRSSPCPCWRPWVWQVSAG